MREHSETRRFTRLRWHAGAPRFEQRGSHPEERKGVGTDGFSLMGKLVFAMMQSLDGYVDGVSGGLALPPPGVALGRRFTARVRGLAGALYGRRIYEVMR